MMMLWITTLCVAIVVIIYVYLSYRRLQWNDTKAILQEIHDQYVSRSPMNNKLPRPMSPSVLRNVSPREWHSQRINDDILCMQSSAAIHFPSVYAMFLQHPDVHYIVWSPHTHTDESLVEQSRDTFLTFCYDRSQQSFLPTFGIFQRCQFTIEMLYYLTLQKDPLQSWADVMRRIGFTSYVMSLQDPTDTSPWYTYFFTIHFGSVPPSHRTHRGKYHLADRHLSDPVRPGQPILFQTWIDHFIDNDYLWTCYQRTSQVYANHPYKLFSDFEMKRFIRTHYDEDVVRQYDNIIPSAFKSDFFRYLFLYKFGGVYMDISVMPIVNMFDYLHESGYSNQITFMTATDNGHRTRLWNGLMYATPHHPFMKYCIDQIMRLRKSTFKHCLYYTGPALLGEAVLVLGKANPSYKLLRFLDGQPIVDPTTKVALFSPKSANGWKSHKRITKDMYRESSKSHYSMHCLYNQILYY